MLFRAPQAARPGELVRVYVNEHRPLRYEDYQRIKGGLEQVFSHLIAETVEPVSLAALGLQPALGTFPRTEAEGQPSAVPQVVLSHDYWTERFGADSRLIGSTIRIDDRAFVVSGVAPSGLISARVLWAPDVYVVMGETAVLLGKGPEILGGRMNLTARLATGVSRANANALVGQLFFQVATQDSVRLARQSWRVDAALGLFAELRGLASIASGFLIAIALAVLLVDCFNVGNPLLARNAARAREFTIRLALGASRGRLVRQLLAELALLAALGAGLALLATRFSTAQVAGALPAEAGLRLYTSANLRVIAFTLFLVTVVVGVSGLGARPAGVTERPDGESPRRRAKRQPEAHATSPRPSRPSGDGEHTPRRQCEPVRAQSEQCRPHRCGVRFHRSGLGADNITEPPRRDAGVQRSTDDDGELAVQIRGGLAHAQGAPDQF